MTGAKADERQTLLKIFHTDPLTADRPGQTLVGDKNYFGAEFETSLTEAGLRPACRGEPERAGSALIKPLRQTIESINQTFKGQLDLKRHSRHTFSARATTLSKINSWWAGRSCAGVTLREGHVSTAEEPEDQEINSGCDEWSDPDGNDEPESEIEDVAEPEQEREANDDAHDHGDGLNDGGPVQT